MTKKYLTPAGSSPSELNLGAVIIAGGMAGVAMWSIAIPPDVCFVPFIRGPCLTRFYTGPQITTAERTHGDLFRFIGLREKDNSGGRC